MSDIAVVAVIKSKPGSEAAVREALTALVGPTREESGNVTYSLYESGTEAGTFFTIESWTAQDDLDQHMQTPHVGAAFAAVGDALAEAPAIHVLNPIDVV